MNAHLEAIIVQARALRAAATPGTWMASDDAEPVRVVAGQMAAYHRSGSKFICGHEASGHAHPVAAADACLIAFAVNNIDTLCDALSATGSRAGEALGTPMADLVTQAEELLAAATEGPWDDCGVAGTPNGYWCVGMATKKFEAAQSDAKLLMFARNNLSLFCAVLKAQQLEIETLRSQRAAAAAAAVAADVGRPHENPEKP